MQNCQENNVNKKIIIIFSDFGVKYYGGVLHSLEEKKSTLFF